MRCDRKSLSALAAAANAVARKRLSAIATFVLGHFNGSEQG